jgi:hypothetical protein
MKKVVFASLLAVASAVPLASLTFAQQPAAPAAGQVQMSEAEYADYNAANTAATPAAKVAAFKAYLVKYPNSAVKTDVLNQILFAASQTGDEAATLSAADALLAVVPGDLRALTFEVYYLRADGDKATDPATKQADLDKAAAFAQKGLDAPKPAGMEDSAFASLKAATAPTFLSAIADDDLSKKDNAGAIATLKKELDGVPVADTQNPQKQLQDVFVLAQTYYTSTSVQTNLDPPAGFLDTIKPAPKPADMVHTLVTSTPDLATLALGDKETALQYGSQEDADKVFDSVKGKSVEFPDVTVVTATADQLVLMVSDDANASKTADFTVNMKESLKTVPAVGAKITVQGTYASYTATPLMITMSDGSVVEPKKKPVAKAPVHRAPVKH